MRSIVRWVLNWIANNASVRLYSSHTAVGKGIGGHDIPQVADCYIILTVLSKAKPIWTGHFRAS